MKTNKLFINLSVLSILICSNAIAMRKRPVSRKIQRRMQQLEASLSGRKTPDKKQNLRSLKKPAIPPKGSRPSLKKKQRTNRNLRRPRPRRMVRRRPKKNKKSIEDLQRELLEWKKT